jgi:L-ascorbate metabolism protein UlaG (beta-lactamase superfamily)
MRCRWLGWAGVELEADGSGASEGSGAGAGASSGAGAGAGAGEGVGERIVIDPLGDPTALYRVLGDAAADVRWPQVVEPAGDRPALAALVTHLHRDHADAAAIASTIAPDAPVLVPMIENEDGHDSAGIAQAASEMADAGLAPRPMSPWESIEIGPFTVTALPAIDGTGESQLSWAVRAGDKVVVHCGDTLFHGWWWRIAQTTGPVDAAFVPINGAVVNFPWRQPPSPIGAAMDPEQAVAAATALAARHTIPIHYDGFDLDPYYRSLADAGARFRAAADEAGLETLVPRIGEAFQI